MTDRPRLIALDPGAPAPAGLQAAADVLRRGGAVGFPTETFYGLAAAALDPASVKRIFALKGRPDSKPLLVLVDSVAMAETVADVTDSARALMKRYWPGALTLVLPARAIVPSDVTAGTGTLGVRVSSHPIAHGLVKTLGEPVTAPSANPSQATPPRTPEEVLKYFDGLVDLVLDAGPTSGGAPSTVLDVSVDPPRLLRKGAVALEGPCWAPV